MKVVIMGCGRVGAQLAIHLVKDGHDVTVLDTRESQFERFLPPRFRGRKVVGDGRDQDTLRRAGVEGADAFVSCTAGDNRNVMAAQMAKVIFDVPRVVCRIYDPLREEMYRMLGLRTISPTKVGARLLMEALIGPRPDQEWDAPSTSDDDDDEAHTERDPNYVIIVGGGAVGFHLAKEMIELGYEVLVIEKNEQGPRARYIEEQLASAVIEGDGCEASVLVNAGTRRAGMFIAVTGDDEDNLVACQVAKRKFEVPLTIARLNDPRNETLFKALGIDVTVSATTAILDKIEMQLPVNRLVSLMQFKKGDLELVEISLPERSPVLGRTLREVLLPQGSLITLLVDDDGTPRIAAPDTVLHPGDVVIAITRRDSENMLREVLTGQHEPV